MTRIVLDAMGGDAAPTNELEAALMVVRELNVELILVGPESCLRQAIEPFEPDLKRLIEIVDAPEVITMNEPVVQAIRRKPRSTIRVGMQLVREGRADAFVSAGNTGAIMATAKMVLRTLGNIDRPALAATMPTVVGKPLVIIDVGANAACKPYQLLQFAVMGDVYVRAIFGIEKPAIGLLSIGEEELKGNKLTLETYKLLEQADLHFIGNVEGQAIYKGAADVIVCDGFTGNVVLKVSEGTYDMLYEVLKQELAATAAASNVGAAGFGTIVGKFKRRFGYEEFGGAPLLGVKDVCVICHGRSTGRAIRNAIGVAADLCQKQVPARIKSEIEKWETVSTLLHQEAEI